MVLRNVILVLGSGWQASAGRLAVCLAQQDRELCVRVIDKRQAAGPEFPDPGSGVSTSDSVIFTDDRSLSAGYAAQGFACIGCAMAEEPFFDGAVLVTDDLGGLDVSDLEECLLHAQGRPVTIARTARLVIREIAEEDFGRLFEISRQDGMQDALEDFGENCFEPERLSAYIRHVYRFYGYGLWSVLLADGTLIGCCGFREFISDAGPVVGVPACEGSIDRVPAGEDTDSEVPAGESLTGEVSAGAGQVELQYMVAPEFRRQGFGTEMCRAALGCVRRRTGQDTVWVRIRPENEPSLRLAKKLGFAYNRTGKDGLLLFSLRVCRSETMRPPADTRSAR